MPAGLCVFEVFLPYFRGKMAKFDVFTLSNGVYRRRSSRVKGAITIFENPGLSRS